MDFRILAFIGVLLTTLVTFTFSKPAAKKYSQSKGNSAMEGIGSILEEVAKDYRSKSKSETSEHKKEAKERIDHIEKLGQIFDKRGQKLKQIVGNRTALRNSLQFSGRRNSRVNRYCLIRVPSG